MRKKNKTMWWVIGILAVLVIFRKKIPMVDSMLSKLTGPKQPTTSETTEPETV
jgi:Sec-independent protein translocase protein TatA